MDKLPRLARSFAASCTCRARTKRGVRTDIDIADFKAGERYVDLSAWNPILDHPPENRQQIAVPDGRQGEVLIVNDPPIFTGFAGPTQSLDSDKDLDVISSIAQSSILSEAKLKALHRYPLVTHRVVNMTSKGKIASMYALVVVGNGNGLVGYGEGKSSTMPQAIDKAFAAAVKGLDFVDRKEDRTVWGDYRHKWGSTIVELRNRPPGFGLRTSPIIHQIAKAAGICDLSAKIHGSRNKMNTIKAVINILHGGAAPSGMGDISRAGLSRSVKGVGMRTVDEIALDRGRKVAERGV